MTEAGIQTNKKRIAVTIVGQGSIVYFIRSGLLIRMKEFCEPVIIIFWNEEDLIEELRSLGFEVHIFPKYAETAGYTYLRSLIDSWYEKKVLKSPSTSIQEKFKSGYYSKRKKIIKFLKNAAEFFKLLNSSYIQKLLSEENELFFQQSCYIAYKNYIESLRIDGLYTGTPFFHAVEMIARICKPYNIPVIASVHSFDNITKRGWPAVFFDHYLVWNKYNKKELIRINPSLKEKIVVAGAPQFDFHFSSSFSKSREEWLNELSIPADKKIILYSGGSAAVLPDEPQYLKHLNDAVSNGLITKNAVILFRCHPLDRLQRWKNYVGESSYIIYDSAPSGEERADHANVNVDDIKKLIATLKYADVHINLCSTMAVDGSAFNKPQIAPAYDEVNKQQEKGLRKMYDQEHYLPIMKSGAVHLAKSKQHLITLVNDALKNPVKFTAGCYKCVEEIITYTDGHTTERIAAQLKKFFIHENIACLQ